jgi:hypothetical protein
VGCSLLGSYSASFLFTALYYPKNSILYFVSSVVDVIVVYDVPFEIICFAAEVVQH